MPREDPVHIPLDEEEEALKLLLQVEPTEEMPGPGANPTDNLKPPARKKRKKKAAAR